MLQHAFARAEIEYQPVGVACTLDAFRLLEPRAPDHRLESICRRRGILLVDPHDASGDVSATAALLRVLLGEGIAPETVQLDHEAFMRLRSRGDKRLATRAQIRRVFALGYASGLSRGGVLRLVGVVVGPADVDELTREQVQDVYDALEPDDCSASRASRVRTASRLFLVVALGLSLALAAAAGAAKLPPGGQLARIAYVVDGDTVALANGAHVRLVQIDTPEVYNSPECYGEQASAITKHLLPRGTLVRLYAEPKTDAVDVYGRSLRYVFRVRDGLNVNIQLVRVGAAAPYFYDYRRGRYVGLLVRLALRALARHVGL
jgi:endonuclease YncB( thermonuclease family)